MQTMNNKNKQELILSHFVNIYPRQYPASISKTYGSSCVFSSCKSQPFLGGSLAIVCVTETNCLVLFSRNTYYCFNPR